MSEVQRLLIEEEGNEGETYEIYVESKTPLTLPDPTIRSGGKRPGEKGVAQDNLVKMQEVHKRIRGYTKFALGAFKDFSEAEVEEVTIKFGIKLGGKTGIPFVTEGSAESNFEIEVKCKFPNRSNNLSSSGQN